MALKHLEGIRIWDGMGISNGAQPLGQSGIERRLAWNESVVLPSIQSGWGKTIMKPIFTDRESCRSQYNYLPRTDNLFVSLYNQHSQKNYLSPQIN